MFQVKAEGWENVALDRLFLQEHRAHIKKSAEIHLKRKIKFWGPCMASQRVWIWLMGERALKIQGIKGEIHNRGVCIRRTLCGLLGYSQIINPAYKDLIGSGPAYVCSITWCDSPVTTPLYSRHPSLASDTMNHAMLPSPPGLFFFSV